MTTRRPDGHTAPPRKPRTKKAPVADPAPVVDVAPEPTAEQILAVRGLGSIARATNNTATLARDALVAARAAYDAAQALALEASRAFALGVANLGGGDPPA